MRDADYKPQRGRRRSQLPESVLHDTARHIAAEWEKELPGCTTGNQPEAVEAAILDFMRRCGIQTIEDFEEVMTKDCGRMHPPGPLPSPPLPPESKSRKRPKPTREEAQRIADALMRDALFTDSIEDE